MIQTIEAVMVSRRVKVPREFAFRSWTEPDRLARWLPARGETCTVEAFDLRPGGAYRMDFGSYVLAGVFVEITPPEKLVFTWLRTGEDADSAESVVAVTFKDLGEATEIEIRHELLPTEEAAELAFRRWTEWLTRNTLSMGMDFMMEETTMTMTTETGWAGKIETEKQLLDQAMARLHDTFSHIPEDKLHFKPTENAKSPLHIAAHTGLTNRFFANVLSTGELPDPSLLANLRQIGLEQEAPYVSRQQVLELLESSHKEMKEAYDNVSIPALEGNPRLQFFATLPAYHTVNHAAQLDYIQTLWGDFENHFGM